MSAIILNVYNSTQEDKLEFEFYVGEAEQLQEALDALITRGHSDINIVGDYRGSMATFIPDKTGDYSQPFELKLIAGNLDTIQIPLTRYDAQSLIDALQMGLDGERESKPVFSQTSNEINVLTVTTA